MSTTKGGCSQCKRKYPLNMKCKCEKVVCLNCRYPESHDCSFDYQKVNQEKIKKDNPVVTSEKLAKV